MAVFLGIVLLIAGVALLRFRANISRRGIESPVREKMLRPAGHSLQQKIQELDESLFIDIFTPCFLTVVLGLAPLIAVATWAPENGTLFVPAALIGIAFLGGGSYWAIRRIRRAIETLSNHAIGLRGEQLVAEMLTPLIARGYQVFHDFPLFDHAKGANIDHIVIGPTGIFVIETKMRRKHRKAPTNKDSYRVEFDGKELHYPTTRDRHGVQQTEANARYLRDYLSKETGKKIVVQGILVIPGWYVHQSRPAAIEVIGHKQILHRIEKSRNALDEDTQRQAARAVERLCRDVKV